MALFDGNEQASALVIGYLAGGKGGLDARDQFGHGGPPHHAVGSGGLRELYGEEREADVRRWQLPAGSDQHPARRGVARLVLLSQLAAERIVVERLEREDHRAAAVAVAVGADLGHQGRIEERPVEERVVIIEQQLHHGPLAIIDRPAGHIDAEHPVGSGERPLLLDHDLLGTTSERDRDELHHPSLGTRRAEADDDRRDPDPEAQGGKKLSSRCVALMDPSHLRSRVVARRSRRWGRRTQEHAMGKKLAAVGMAAAIGVGGLTVAAVNPAGAQNAPATTTQASGQNATREGPLQRALAALVADGTLTQEQADAVASTTKAEAESGRAEHKEKAKARRTATLAVVAEALGSTPEKVKAALADGTSIAAQAEAKGIDRQAVDDALTKQLNANIDAAVADGKINEERAAKAKEHVDQAVDRILDADGSGGGGGRGTLRDRIKDRRGN